MGSTNSVRKLQILYFSKKNKKIKNLKSGEKKWPDIGIYKYYSYRVSERAAWKSQGAAIFSGENEHRKGGKIIGKS